MLLCLSSATDLLEITVFHFVINIDLDLNLAVRILGGITSGTILGSLLVVHISTHHPAVFANAIFIVFHDFTSYIVPFTFYDLIIS